MKQCTDTVLMVRPANFGFNPETAENNTFQHERKELTKEEIQARALEEFDLMVGALQNNGIHVHVVEDSHAPVKPDAVFPNNWFTTHSNGAVITYPLESIIRRHERRKDILKKLEEDLGFTRRYSLEQYEDKEQFLEGTGSLILDRIYKKVYACLSSRTDPIVLDKFCALTGYERIVFNASADGKPIYHTNVLMSIGESLAVICTEVIDTEEEREYVLKHLEKSGRTIIQITELQLKMFAGNVLQLNTKDNRSILAMSRSAQRSLTPIQLQEIEEQAAIVSFSLDTIEHIGGGSARCMLAEIFTPDNSFDF